MRKGGLKAALFISKLLILQLRGKDLNLRSLGYEFGNFNQPSLPFNGLIPSCSTVFYGVRRCSVPQLFLDLFLKEVLRRDLGCVFRAI